MLEPATVGRLRVGQLVIIWLQLSHGFIIPLGGDSAFEQFVNAIAYGVQVYYDNGLLVRVARPEKNKSERWICAPSTRF